MPLFPKMMIMITIGACALVAFRRFGARRKTVLPTCLAMFFGWTGDILLTFAGMTWFLLGMLSFFVGHVFYIRTFVRLAAPGPVPSGSGKRGWIALLVALYVLAGGIVALLNVRGAFFLPVFLYASALMTLIFSSLYGTVTRRSGRLALCLAGACLFTVSDALIGIDVFSGISFAGRGTLVIVTYIIAQALIATGIVLEERASLRMERN